MWVLTVIHVLCYDVSLLLLHKYIFWLESFRIICFCYRFDPSSGKLLCLALMFYICPELVCLSVPLSYLCFFLAACYKPLFSVLPVDFYKNDDPAYTSSVFVLWESDCKQMTACLACSLNQSLLISFSLFYFSLFLSFSCLPLASDVHQVHKG